MPVHRRAGRRAPLAGLAAALVLLVLAPAALGADWSPPSRIPGDRGARLDSLHQLSNGREALHLVHPRIGPGHTDDRVLYQRSRDGGARWSSPRTIFAATNARRHVIPNLALDANGKVVAVAWRVRGPGGTALFVRVSPDGGVTFGDRRAIVSSSHADGVGVPAVAVGNKVIAVAWTDRSNGKVKVRISRNGGKGWKPARTMGRTKLSIDCRKRVSDGLVGLTAADRRVHVAWSHAAKRSCIASSIRMRSSTDAGAAWGRQRTVTKRRSYGWPELDARGRTVVATVQSPSGGLIVARSAQNGRNWSDRLIKARKGHSLSAGDVLLLPKGKAIIGYVDERVRKSRLIATKVVSRRSPDDGRTFRAAKTIAPMARRLRMAPNLAAGVTVVYQSGALDGSPRDLFVSRLR